MLEVTTEADTKNHRHDSTILDVFWEAAQHNLDKIQIEFQDEYLSAKKFWQDVCLKAHNLKSIFNQYLQKEIPCGEPIAIASIRSLETLSDLCAILFSGGGFVPYDPFAPKERLEYIFNNADIKMKICHDSVFLREQSVSLPKIEKVNSLLSETVLNFQVYPRQLAYLMHTSGSTGQPKGVKVSHRALWHYYKWFGSLEFIHTCERVDFSTSLTFDGAITTTLVALAYGKTIVVCPEEIKNSPHAFLHYLIQKKIDLCKSTPSYFRLILQVSESSFVKIPQVINWLITGEEMSPQDTVAWLKLYPHHVFYNSYGPTEATVTCSKFRIDRHNINDYIDNIPIEQNSRACHFHIVDSYMKHVPNGVKGELYIEGPILADCYLNKQEETNQAFIAKENGAIWYRTGDEVMSKPDGTIYYFGRIDNQVKIRGVRVELEEVRLAICSFADALDAKVIVHKAHDFAQIVAFIVPRQIVVNETLFCSNVHNHLVRKIPATMMPAHMIVLEKLPRNLADKIDISALKILAKAFPLEERKMLVENPLEMSILQIWREFLPPCKIGTGTNFFHLGGHSLLAMQVMDKINRYLNIKLPPALIFQKPTIRELSQAIYDSHANHSLHHICHNKNASVLFLIHPATGMAHLYQGLKNSLKEFDFYALSNDRFGDMQNPYASIEEMAYSYIKILTAHCPIGPYVIGGFCTGGVVAFEMVRQLQALGKGPVALILIDSFKLQSLGTAQEREIYNKSQLALKEVGNNSSLGKKIVHELEHNRGLVVNYQLSLCTVPCLFIQCKHIDTDDLQNKQLQSLKQDVNGWRSALTSAQVKYVEITASHRTLFNDAANIKTVGDEIRQFCSSLSREYL